MIETIESHIPFFATFGACVVLGAVLSDRVFTVQAATRPDGRRGGPYHWLRELLPVALLLGAGLLGIAWPDPEQRGWDTPFSVAYFVLAAVAALPSISIARGLGYRVRLPGDSIPPAANK